MKKYISRSIFVFIAMAILASSCGATKEKTILNGANEKELLITNAEREAFNEVQGDTVTIANEETEYEIIIIDPGFYTWLNSIARPKGYYSQSFLENRNKLMVINWNQRVMQPQQYDPNLYELRIDYEPNIDYGYEVNYKLYNYFIFFQRRYNQRLGPFIPRI